jgi:hypothetical protein
MLVFMPSPLPPWLLLHLQMKQSTLLSIQSGECIPGTFRPRGRGVCLVTCLVGSWGRADCVLLWMLLTLVDWLLEARRPVYVYRLVSYILSHIRLHIYLRLLIRLHWYEPLSLIWAALLILAALLRHIFIHQLHIKRTWAVGLTMQVHMQHFPLLLRSVASTYLRESIHTNKVHVNSLPVPH